MEKANSLFYVPVHEVIKPTEGHCHVNKYWIVKPFHGVVFNDFGPFELPGCYCHTNEEIANHVAKKSFDGCVVVFLSTVYIAAAQNWLRGNL